MSLIATNRETFNLHPGGMIFGASITLNRVLEVERVPEALKSALRRWFTDDQIASATIGKSLEHDASEKFWEWQTVLAAHDIGIYAPIENGELLWINFETYWHDPRFAASGLEAIFVPDLAENQALASAFTISKTGELPEKIAAMFLSVNPAKVIETACAVIKTSSSNLDIVDMSGCVGHDLRRAAIEYKATPSTELLQQTYSACQKSLLQGM